MFDCKGCRAKISLTAGTIFHKTRAPLIKWYWLIYHMAMDKVGVSISERLGCGVMTEEGQQLLEAIRSDGWRSYGKAAKNKELQHFKVILRDPKAAGRLLPWVHRIISNVKAVITGTHRGVSEKHLQSYLSEVCYRFNRRFWEKELFDRLVKACVSTETITYPQLVNTENSL